MRLPTRDMARTAADILLAHDLTRSPAVIFNASLIVRGSSGPAKV
ncbi:MAG: hypothetical protein WDN06_11525 [Asticcacaulis sp.]